MSSLIHVAAAALQKKPHIFICILCRSPSLTLLFTLVASYTPNGTSALGLLFLACVFKKK